MNKRINTFIANIRTDMSDYEYISAIAAGEITMPKWVGVLTAPGAVMLYDKKDPSGHSVILRNRSTD